ncbi:MAG: SDR family oxidoreductase [Geitlerinemataceae cyanobacterium]
MKVCVFGATGRTGRRVVEELVRCEIDVRAVVRDRDRASVLPAGVETVVADVGDSAAVTAAIAGCSDLICATGATPSLNAFGPFAVDYIGTKNLVDSAKAQNLDRFVLVSSMCVSNFFHPLNLFWLVLFWKKQAEEYLATSGLTYTIVRPGGLKDEDDDRKIVMESADTLSEGSIPREKVARVAVEALSQTDANNKIVEVVAREDAPDRPISALFAGV